MLDNRAGKLTLTMRDKNLHGLLDGGHPYNILPKALFSHDYSSQALKFDARGRGCVEATTAGGKR